MTGIEVTSPENVKAALRRNPEAIEKALGKGSPEVLQRVTVNIGTIRGGLKMNMIPNRCTVEVDIRLPAGLEKELVIAGVKKILTRYPEITMEEVNFTPPFWCEPEGEMFQIICGNVKALKGFEPTPTISLGGTDARLWRQRGIPAYVYGPSPQYMGAANESVEVEEFLHIVRTHVLSAYDYLTR